MADVIHLNYFTLSVLNRFGIELGFGDKTVDEVCKQNQDDVDFFLEIVNIFVDKKPLSEGVLWTTVYQSDQST